MSMAQQSFSSVTLRRIASSLIACGLLAPIAPALAEKADRDQPVSIKADRATVDDKQKIQTFEGRVKLTQGSLVITTDKLIVTQDADGFQRGVAIGGEGNLARMRQKREGKDEMIEAEGERIEYDARNEKARLVQRAWLRMGSGNEACADTIEYNAANETYQALQSGSKAGGQVEMVMPGKKGGQVASNDTCERRRAPVSASSSAASSRPGKP